MSSVCSVFSAAGSTSRIRVKIRSIYGNLRWLDGYDASQHFDGHRLTVYIEKNITLDVFFGLGIIISYIPAASIFLTSIYRHIYIYIYNAKTDAEKLYGLKSAQTKSTFFCLESFM